MTTKARAPQRIPPDPEGMNDDRAASAEAAITAFVRSMYTDREDALADLLCDLMHWADREPVDFDAELARARFHYNAETEAQP